MNVKETLEQCLHAWKQVEHILDLRYFDHVGRDLEVSSLNSIEQICRQEIKALEHDIKEVNEDGK